MDAYERKARFMRGEQDVEIDDMFLDFRGSDDGSVDPGLMAPNSPSDRLFNMMTALQAVGMDEDEVSRWLELLAKFDAEAALDKNFVFFRVRQSLGADADLNGQEAEFFERYLIEVWDCVNPDFDEKPDADRDASVKPVEITGSTAGQLSAPNMSTADAFSRGYELTRDLKGATDAPSNPNLDVDDDPEEDDTDRGSNATDADLKREALRIRNVASELKNDETRLRVAEKKRKLDEVSDPEYLAAVLSDKQERARKLKLENDDRELRVTERQARFGESEPKVHTIPIFSPPPRKGMLEEPAWIKLRGFLERDVGKLHVGSSVERSEASRLAESWKTRLICSDSYERNYGRGICSRGVDFIEALKAQHNASRERWFNRRFYDPNWEPDEELVSAP